MAVRGAVAERLGRGLQSLVQRFESARRLYSSTPPVLQGFFIGPNGYFSQRLHGGLCHGAFHRFDRARHVIDFEPAPCARSEPL